MIEYGEGQGLEYG